MPSRNYETRSEQVRQLTRRSVSASVVFFVHRVVPQSPLLLATFLFLIGCSGVRLDPSLCRDCKGEACRLACGVCAGEGRLFDRWKSETCVWCHGFGRTWERVPIHRVERQPDGSEKTVVKWVARHVWCRHCGGRGTWRKKAYNRCEPCGGSGAGEFPFLCAVCEGTGERASGKGKRPERKWVEAE